MSSHEKKVHFNSNETFSTPVREGKASIIVPPSIDPVSSPIDFMKLENEFEMKNAHHKRSRRNVLIRRYSKIAKCVQAVQGHGKIQSAESSKGRKAKKGTWIFHI